MKTAASVLLFVLCSGIGAAMAETPQGLGFGVIVGDPTGLTIKQWLSPNQAFDAGVGFSGDAAIYADYLWHAWDLLPQPQGGRAGAYVGLGPRIETQRETVLGIRMIAGLGFWPAKRPIELFLEAGPVFRLTPDRDADVDAGLGIRFYFGGLAKAPAAGT